MSGLYIHIPFCKQACSYCDFYFLTRQQLREPFVDSLVREIENSRGEGYTEEPVKTVYIGGGTPSLLTENQLSRIFDALRHVFDIQAEEVTMELNPDDVTIDYLRQLRNLGINRASMGVQSFHPEILQFMHRAHTREEAMRALDALQKTGFSTYTADLIYGNPGQTQEMLRRDIRQLLEYNPPHISAYSLTVEPNTRLGKQVDLGRISPPDDEEVSVHFDIVTEELGKAGLRQYEISNFAIPGKEAVHNSNYWRHENYIGFGPSAHSFHWDGHGAVRWKNKPDLKAYLEMDFSGIREDHEVLDLHSLAEERLMLGLRTVWGVNLERLKSRYGYELNSSQTEWIEIQSGAGNLVLNKYTLTLTKQGFRIADLLTVDLLSRN
ncbi:coproporphyrinogen III oxidase [Rhodohalobacter mucosus]|uniref:Heme chaperone HemW n=2 Tax=Rhodohalobacter mucosus TaxID=2079485 RepID=A0A316TQS1_9BACT|nr:coproporphyrinogen III oxidase [Rhodohalobacter mucosus]